MKFLSMSVLLLVVFGCAFGLTDMSFRLVSTTDPLVLDERLMSQSTPGEELFRRHMTIDELYSHTTASEACITKVRVWLLQNGASDIRLGALGDNMFFAVDDAQIDSVFPRLVSSETVRIGKKSVGFPSSLEDCVRFAFVHPKSRMLRREKKPMEDSTDGSGFPGMNQNPDTIRARYSVPSEPIATGTSFSQGVAEFEGEQFYQSDVDTFDSNFSIPNNTIKVSGPNSGGYFGEGIMDLQYIQSIANGATTWWIAGNKFDFTLWTERVLAIKPLPLVLSISWGSGESGFDNSSMATDTEDFRKLGLLGATVLAASGDQGTGSTGFFTCGTFDPNWPASSPFITAVGATYSNATDANETAWNGSGGGFSSYFEAPIYQRKAIAKYTSTATMPPAQYFTAGGRGTPDVSALGTNFEVFCQGWGTETGTSAATPTFAAVISRIVAKRLSEGKPSLGFINPSLYHLGAVGFDVTVGNNQNSACPAGFSAAPGWDAVSGLGTPDYAFLDSHL